MLMDNDIRNNSLRTVFDFDERQCKPVLKVISPSGSGDSYSHTSDESISKSQRQVILAKSNESAFGFNIIGGNMREGIYVSFILAGGPADLSKKVYKGDQILKINGNDVSRMSHSTAVQLLKESGNRVSLLVVSKPEEFRSCETHIQEFDSIMQSSTIGKLSCYSSMGSLRTTTKRTLYVRTLFNYDVSSDCGLPNKGLSFKFGDILHVTNASDPEWWQARRVNLDSGEDDTDLGIIPSKGRVERKHRSKAKKVRIICSGNNASGSNSSQNGNGHNSASFSDQDDSSNNSGNSFLNNSLADMKLTSGNCSLPRSTNGKPIDGRQGPNGSSACSNSSSGSSSSTTANNAGGGGGLFTIFKSNKSNKSKASAASAAISPSSANSVSKTMSRHTSISNYTDSSETGSVDLEELFYQPVIQSDNIPFRPVIILGAHKEELNACLLKEHSTQFGICIPHTTRPMGPEDVSGEEFHFVSSMEMDRLMSGHHFIETGRNGAHFYGTSVSAVVRVLETERHCLLDVSRYAVRRLGITGLWPIVLLVEDSRPNSRTDRLRQDFLPYITDIISDWCDFESIYARVLEAIAMHNEQRKIWLPSGLDM